MEKDYQQRKITANDAIEKFSQLGRLATLQELLMRLLADKTKEISCYSQEKILTKVEKEIIRYYAKECFFQEGEADILTLSRKVRNKIFHGDFLEALKIIKELPQFKTVNSSYKFDLGNFDSEVKNFLFLDFYKTGETEEITQETEFFIRVGGIFGDLIEAYEVGALDIAIKMFDDSNKLLKRLAYLHDEKVIG